MAELHSDNGLVQKAENLTLNDSNATEHSAPIAEPDGQSEASCSNNERSSSQKAPSVGSSSTTSPNITKVFFYSILKFILLIFRSITTLMTKLCHT